MEAKSITVQDLKNLAERKLAVQMPDYSAAVSTRNLVSYVRKAHPLQKGENYETSITELQDGKYEIAIRVTTDNKE